MTLSIVAICTYKRPVMLQQCLDSVFSQALPEGWRVELLIVDNDAESTLLPVIRPVIERAPLKVHYVAEPQQGIPYARNAACRESLHLGADWLLFLDDDEKAEPGWLQAYARAANSKAADAYTGSVRFMLPAALGGPRQIGYTLGNKADLTPLKRAATNNVMISTAILMPPHAMEFDTCMAFSGGSDLEFFTRLTEQGGRILFVKDAVVSEEVLENRLKLGWKLHRQYRVSANKIYIKFKKYGVLKTVVFSQKELLMRMVEGLLFGIATFPSVLAGRKRFEDMRFKSLVSFAKAAGIVTGLFGCHPQPYRKIDGF
jgi:succinoglycan biosynthesis protein ExoM